MRIRIQTQVKSSIAKVKQGFTSNLFLKLNPPFPPVKLRHFGGCKKGDRVELELNFILFKQIWISDIVEDEETVNRWFFIDKGVKLPFFLKKWTHHHGVEGTKGTVNIIDDIEFTTGTLLTDLFMYPLLLGQFLYRKPIYRRVFNQK